MSSAPPQAVVAAGALQRVKAILELPEANGRLQDMAHFLAFETGEGVETVRNILSIAAKGVDATENSRWTDFFGTAGACPPRPHMPSWRWRVVGSGEAKRPSTAFQGLQGPIGLWVLPAGP